MRTTLKNIEERTRLWMLEHADSPQAQWWLGVIAFFESSVLPLPPSTFMVAMIVLGKKRQWAYLALFTTLTSVLGGLFGYLVGSVLYDSIGVWIIESYNLADEIEHVGELFANNAFWSILVGAFTPIPYKAFTIGAGFFTINIVTFTVASIIWRGLRYFILGFFADLLGEHVAKRIFKYFAITTLVAIGILVLFAVWGSF